MLTALPCQTAPTTKRISADVTAVWFDAAMEGVVPCQVALNGEHLPTDVTCHMLIVSAHYGGDGDL